MSTMCTHMKPAPSCGGIGSIAKLSLGDRGDVALAQPLAALHADARLRLHERLLVAGLDEHAPPAGAEQEDVAGADVDTALPFDRGLEVVGRDDEAAGQPVDALERGDVEQHAAPGDAGGLGLDAVVQRAARRDVARGEAVVELFVVEHVGEAVPLRGALQRHHHVVVGVAEAAGEVVLRLARRRHEVQRVASGCRRPAAGPTRRTGCRG